MGIEKKAFDKSITENHCSFAVILLSKVCGFATSTVSCFTMSFTFLRSCIILQPDVAFLTGKIGVKHLGAVVSTKIPAFSMSVITGLMPSSASFDMGYCRTRG